jgi:hypothetical protein
LLTSFIDITLHGDNISIHNRRFLKTPSLSDHPFISFSVSLKSNYKKHSTFLRVSPLSSIDKEVFLAKVSEGIKLFTAHKDLTNTINKEASILAAAVRDCARSSRKPNLVPPSTSSRNMPW